MYTVNALSKKFCFVECGSYQFVYYAGRCIGYTDGNAYYTIKPDLTRLVAHRTLRTVFPLAKFIELPLEEVEKMALTALKEALMV